MRYDIRSLLALTQVLAALTMSDLSVADAPQDSAAMQPLSVSEMIARKDSLFGTEVAVKGYLAVDFENINLYQSRKDFKLNNRHCVTVGVNELFQREGKKHNHELVVIHGLLKREYVDEGTICLSCCSDYAILPNRIGKQ